MGKDVEKKVEDAIGAEKLDELKQDVEENKDNLKKGKGFWAFVWKWTKILLLPFGVIAAIVIFLLKALGNRGGDDDELTTDDVPADNGTNE